MEGKKIDGKTDEKKMLIELSSISLALDSYDNIFSDFDPRPYSQRMLFDDFLSEAKKASKEKVSGRIELRLLIPAKEKNPEHEKTIKKKLHEHFKRHFNLLKDEVKRIRKNGVILILIGISMMLAATYVYTLGSAKFIFNVLLVVFEPGGWFMTWYGLDKIFYDANLKRHDLNFYEKMTKSEISFLPY